MAESRISGKFVVNTYSGFVDVDTSKSITDMALASIGSPETGTVVELTVTLRTTGDRPWTVCKRNDNWGKCGVLVAPGKQCFKIHWHKPEFVNGVCAVCGDTEGTEYTGAGTTYLHPDKDVLDRHERIKPQPAE